VVVALIVSSVAFSSELTGITRQAMALTMMAALVMVLFDRTMLKRPAQIVIVLLIVAISFTHYTTSYLTAAILFCAWLVSWMWSRGLLGTPREKIDRHRRDMRSRNIINGTLVGVALIAAFGWNLGITRNNALTNPISYVIDSFKDSFA
jgi:chromate transport protein ChrA